MDDMTRALEKAAEAVLERFFGGSSGLKEYPEAIARDHARAAVLAFLKEMPIKVISKSAHMTITRYWSASEMIAAIEKEQT